MARSPDDRPPSRLESGVSPRVLCERDDLRGVIDPCGLDPDCVKWGPQGAVLSGQRLGGADRTLRLRLVAVDDGCGAAW
jgi:hypothetical protein